MTQEGVTEPVAETVEQIQEDEDDEGAYGPLPVAKLEVCAVEI